MLSPVMMARALGWALRNGLFAAEFQVLRAGGDTIS
jgi:hypothetical protein